MKKFILLFCFIFASSSAFSQYLAQENFSYAAGNLVPNGGWTAISAGGTNPIQVTAPTGLSFSDFNGNPYTGSGVGGAASLTIVGGEDDAKLFTGPATTGSVYASFMLQMTTPAPLPGDYFLGMRTGTANNSRLYVRTATGGFNLGIEKNTGAGVSYAPGVYLTGTTYLIVLKYTFVAGATNDQMSLFVFSSADVVPMTEPTPTFGPITFGASADPVNLTDFYLRQAGGGTTGSTELVDGIFVNSAWDNGVLPVELSSFTSTVNNRDVTLNWTTQTETNNSGFEIERSINGVWANAGFVAGNGNTTLSHSYSFTDRGLNIGTYSYRLKQIDYNGAFEYHNLTNEVIIGAPSTYSLSQNYPNPFNPSTVINYQLPKAGDVNITVYDLSGKEVKSLVNGKQEAGFYSVNLNASSLSSGVYFYTIRTNDFTNTKSMLLVK